MSYQFIASEAYVILTAYNDNGGVVGTQALTVSGHAKVVNMTNTIFSQDISAATSIAFSAVRDMVGFQLNCSADATMLDGLPALTGGSSTPIVLNVPYEPNYGSTCVSSSFTLVLKYYLPTVTFNDVFGIYGVPPLNETVWKEFEGWVEETLNMEMFTYNNGNIADITKCIDKGYPVVVLQKHDIDDTQGHDRVVIGYDPVNRLIILNDPSYYGASYIMTYELFDTLWNFQGYGSTRLLYLIFLKGSVNPLSTKPPYS